MNTNQSKIIQDIKKDCIALKKLKQLTEFGLGQLELCEILLENKRRKIK